MREAASRFTRQAAVAYREKAAVFVKKIEGDYFNVVGLPLNTLYEILAAM